jgi:hypothetical protein
LRLQPIPAEELSDQDLADIRRVLAGGKPRAYFVDLEEEQALYQLTAELAAETRRLRAELREVKSSTS